MGAAYKEKLDVFTITIQSLLNGYSDCFHECIQVIDNILERDIEDSKYDGVERQSIVARGLTNVKNLLEKATPMRHQNTIDDFIDDEKTHTKASMKTDSQALMQLLKVLFCPKI